MAAQPTAEELNERQRQVLEAVVESHVATSEPVASKKLVEAHGWSISPATIRNTMAQLEERGYLHQPHTSAGRIPSQKAYRLYVDVILERGSSHLPATLRETIRSRLLPAQNARTPEQWEDLFNSTCQLLAQLSHYIGIVLNGEARDSILDRMRLVALGERNVLVVLILRPGIVKHRMMTLKSSATNEIVQTMETALNQRFAGKTLRDIRRRANQIQHLYELFEGEHRQFAVEITRGAFLSEFGSDIYFDGIRNLLTPAQLEDAARLGTLYETLESRESVVSLFDSPNARSPNLRVRIGSEIPTAGLDVYSVVSATYRLSGDRVGSLGVIGPMRMSYTRVIPLVRMTANLLTSYFEAL